MFGLIQSICPPSWRNDGVVDRVDIFPDEWMSLFWAYIVENKFVSDVSDWMPLLPVIAPKLNDSKSKYSIRV